MSLWSEPPTRVRVMRGTPIVRDADVAVVSSSRARTLVVDPLLVESARADGHREGYDAGFAAGLADAASVIEAERAQLRHRLDELLPRLAGAADDLFQRETTARADIETQVVTVAFEIAQALLGHELAHTETLGRDALARALQFAPDRGGIVARLHPDDLATVGDVESLVVGRPIQIVGDASLAPGDCIVDVDACRIDARLDQALARVREVIDGGGPAQ